MTAKKTGASVDLSKVHNDPAVATFQIGYRQYLNAEGTLAADLPDFATERDTMVAMYRCAVLTRTFDAKAVALQRTGKLGTFPSSLGQEAVSVAIGAAMSAEDVLLTTYREQGAHFFRGVTLKEVFMFWGGDERGCKTSGPKDDFPFSIPIASHTTHAVGVATAMKLRGQAHVAVCVLGDGATSKGDFYEAINLAGVWQLPVVFVVINNGWAISVPRHKQSSCETLAQKSIAGGFEGEQVDGNDIIAVRTAMDEALAQARAGLGPSLIEALTYRLSDHTTADDASRYRAEDDVSARWKKDPLVRLRNYLVGQDWWGKSDEESLLGECKSRVNEAADAYLDTTPQAAEAKFESLYDDLPEVISAQRQWVK
ncbi:MAG: pyruvate dehydrogenase (acetyl-transferring) E1 component subunit alpha [Magnetovibrio sp.]|nr:pyruvate dehydrogenase (acetyl-transferring) E1 component subunit alpha [Magnetovibrio sp.]